MKFNNQYYTTMKKTLFLLVLCALALGAKAQNNLAFENESLQGDAYANSGDTARVVIRCHESMPLTFYSRADGGNVEPFEVRKEGSYDLYDFRLPTDAADDELKLLARRVFVISAKDHNNLEIPLKLSSKQYMKIRVYDPDDNKLNSPYIRLRNEAYNEFKNMNYTKARQLFQQAALMSDADRAESAVNLSLVDSVIYYRDRAEELYDRGRFLESYRMYSRVVALNSDDVHATTRKQESNNHYKSVCDIAYTKAEYLFNEKKYEAAKEQYQIMLNEKCSDNIPVYSNVEERIQTIDDILRSRKQHATVLTYEWTEDTPLGFHVGKYKEHKWGGFFQLDLNKQTFEATRSNTKYGDKPEVNLSFGWTVKIVKPVWLHFGLGGTTKFYYGEFQEGQYPGKEYSYTSLEDRAKLKDGYDIDKKEQKFNAAFAASPVIGLTIKYSYFAIRGTYQYRYSMKKELEDFLGKQRFSVGVGFAF